MEIKGNTFLLNPLEHKIFTQKMISRSIYNLKINTICMYDIPFDRSILQLSNGMRHVMPSIDRMLELTAKHRWISRLTAGCVPMG
jgi:CRISPR/Cas system CMR-associated protein Cmr3 (group 5 of RAMP superfamily)